MSIRLARFVIAALSACGFAAPTQAQQPATTITLACKGTTSLTTPTSPTDPKPDPISMGLIINFADRTVLGFFDPGDDFPVKITDSNDQMIAFSGQSGSMSFSKIDGTIDRVTGDAQASIMVWFNGKYLRATNFALQCKPAQRMF